MNEIAMIDIERLHPHPQNPRKDLGDLTELTESIKQNGILQNLTVVPVFSPEAEDSSTMDYTVVIGHRRRAAAKAADVKQLPCVITNMDERQQLSTMMVENMQRSDLTLYEQAQGFQLLLDFGETIDSVAELSGFSASTIRRRVKLLEYNEDKLKKSIARGGTLADYAALDKIKDPKARERLLNSIGTNNFQNEYKAQLDLEKRKKELDKIEEKLSTFATKQKARNCYNAVYINYYSAAAKDPEIPEDADKVKYYYTRDDYGISLYKESPKDSNANAEAAARAAEKAKKKAVNERKEKELEEILKRHRSLRRQHLKNHLLTQAQARFLVEHVVYHAIESNFNVDIMDVDTFYNMDIVGEYEDEADEYEEFKLRLDTEILNNPNRTLAAILYLSLESKIKSDRFRSYEGYEVGYKTVHRCQDEIDALYAFMEDIGYEISDEEREIQNGTHSVFVYEEDAS